MNRRLYIVLAVVCFFILLALAWSAPELPSTIDRSQRSLKPWEYWPLGTDMNGRPLIEYATQGARVIAVPSLVAGVLVAFFGMLGGLLRCIELPTMQTTVQFIGEVIGALQDGLLGGGFAVADGLAFFDAIGHRVGDTCAPCAIDEAVAARLGGTRLEALKAHGFGAWRIYMHHIVVLNTSQQCVKALKQ